MTDTADKLVKCINMGDVNGLSALASKDCMVSFEDMTVIPWAVYVKVIEAVVASFPDFSISGFKKVVSGNKISLVDCVVGGTHTGAPYGLPNTPGCPTVKAAGVAVLNDPETLELTMEGGKITSFQIIAGGEKSGPPGLYNQVAGLVVF
jgi:hypothetical protein